jgi:translation initiation factor IF-3
VQVGCAELKQEVATIKNAKTIRVNRMIKIPRILVVDENGEQLGVLDTSAALAIAEERGLDLVEVAPMARPPVCRIMDYGRYKYELSKKARKARQQSHTQKVKTIKFRPKTDDHDYNFKKKHITTFLQEGNKVRVIMQYRGREISHLDLGLQVLRTLIEEVSEWGAPETSPQQEGRTVTFIIAPRKVAGRETT